MIADRSRHKGGHHRTTTLSSAPAASTASDPLPTTVVLSLLPPHLRSSICTNCNASGHSIEHCWEPGGGDVGGKKYHASRAKAHITTDLIPTTHDTATTTLSLSVDTIHDTSPTSSSIVPPVPVSPTQSDIFYAYALCDWPMVVFVSSVSTPYQDFVQSLDPVAFAIFQQCFNSILDSRCMTHIICDRRFFWIYHPEQATPVGTANYGILNTLACGEVRFTVLIGGRMHTICLQDCLHAPDVPINLLSVGAMTERDFEVYFEKKGTFVHTPSTSSLGAHLIFMAIMINCLSFLYCDFVLPPMPHLTLPLVPPTILAAPALPLSELLTTSFPHVTVTPEL